VPCARLSWPFRQLLRARKWAIPSRNRIVSETEKWPTSRKIRDENIQRESRQRRSAACRCCSGCHGDDIGWKFSRPGRRQRGCYRRPSPINDSFDGRSFAEKRGALSPAPLRVDFVVFPRNWTRLTTPPLLLSVPFFLYPTVSAAVSIAAVCRRWLTVNRNRFSVHAGHNKSRFFGRLFSIQLLRVAFTTESPHVSDGSAPCRPIGSASVD